MCNLSCSPGEYFDEYVRNQGKLDIAASHVPGEGIFLHYLPFYGGGHEKEEFSPLLPFSLFSSLIFFFWGGGGGKRKRSEYKTH